MKKKRVSLLKVTFWNVTDSEDQRGHTPEHFQRKRRSADGNEYSANSRYEYQTRIFVGKEHKNGASLTNLTADQRWKNSLWSYYK